MDNWIMTSLHVTLMVMTVMTIVSGYCLYGNGGDCVFPCHCARREECGTGECTSGCADGALNVKWRGRGCQIGNVAQGKSATQTGDHWPASNGVDGQIARNGRDCAHPYRASGGLAEWRVDLGDIYKVYSIIIQNRRDCCRRRTSMFTITMRNSSVDEKLCYDYNIDHDPGNVLQFNCTQPVIGRYIRFKRKTGGYQKASMNFCEFIAIGYKYIDCSQTLCPEGATCNDVTGCDFCIGSYQPDCKTACKDGSYGINCNNSCGKCLNNVMCNKTDGNCGADGCQQWFVDDRCQSEIVIPKRTNETTNVGESNGNSLIVTWIAIDSITKNISQFYGYTLFYKESNAGVYIKGSDVPHEDSNLAVQLFIDNRTPIRQATIGNLSLNTEYEIMIRPYREMRGEREYGTPYPVLIQKTKCGVPEQPLIESSNIELGYGGEKHKITIFMTPTEFIDIGCDLLINIQVEYEYLPSQEVKTVDINTTISNITLTDLFDGEYNIRITITNNENFSSTSESIVATFSPTTVLPVTSTENAREHMKKDTETGDGPTTIIASVVAVVVVLAVVIPLTVILLLKKRRRENVKESDENEQTSIKPNRSDSNQGETNFGIEGAIENQYHIPVAEIEESSDEDETERDELGLEDNLYENSDTLTRGVLLAEFEEYVKKRQMKVDDLKDEYKTLPAADQSKCLIAVTEENKKKNRFLNIYPYDSTRVVLKNTEDGLGDYINANYITGYNKPREYIATQGTRPATAVHLWLMIWQEKANRIIMVANLEEMGRKRCYQYWPVDAGITEQLGPFLITMEAEEACADYTTRIFTVQKENIKRTVRHYHFTSWEDKSRPLFGATTLMTFYRKIHAYDRQSRGPMVVHCSAGVGRTGTFIALDILMKQAKKEGKIDIYGWVEKLRKERMLMVQTTDQYIFLHEALVEFIKCGDTSYDCTTLQQTFNELCQPQSGESELQKQFQMLNTIRTQVTDTEKDGLDEINKTKNRNLEIIPDDRCRPYLQGRANYINAVFVDSFKAHDSCLVTQTPLPNTAVDFWRLVCEEKSSTIIMLNNLDGNDQSCQPYWPQQKEATEEYGKIQVKLLKTNPENNSNIVIRRDFEVTESHGTNKGEPDKTVLKVCHFQLLTWPNDDLLPPKSSDLLDLMDKVQLWQQHNKTRNSKGNTIIHCLDGGSHSGLYCAVSHTLDRMKIEQEVDAFLAVRYIGRSRPQFVATLVEYKFLYRIALEYMSRYTDYANFEMA